MHIDTIVYEIIDHCNLHCAYCSNRSPLRPKKEKTVEQVERDIRFLNQFVKLTQFNISGGEPLLHTDIGNVLKVIRQVLGPFVEILLLTNGTKITEMSDEFFSVLVSRKIRVSITKYFIDGAKYDEAERILGEKGILAESRLATSFVDFTPGIDPTGNQNPVEMFRKCGLHNFCFHYDGKKIYACRPESNAQFLNSHFGYNIEYSGISPSASEEDFKKYFSSPCPTCRFCIYQNMKLVPWV